MRTNKTQKARSTIIIGMFLLHAIASAGWAVKTGELVTWGSDYYGLVSNTPAGNDFVAVSACKICSVALKIDGSLVAWGSDSAGQVSNTPTGNDFTDVAVGGGHVVALKTDGSLVAWGFDGNGQVSNTPSGNDFVAIAAGENHNVALKFDGSLVSWGSNVYYVVKNTPTGNDFIAISAGYWHSIALKSDGSLISWGDTRMGQTNTPAGNDFVAISANGAHNVALKSDGSMAAWGYDVFGQVSDMPAGNDFVAVAAGEVHSLAIKSDGSLVAWGRDNYEQVSNPPAGNDFVAVSGGNIHSVVIRETEITPTYTLMTNVNPSGSGFVTKNPDKSSYSGGEYVQLTATAYSGYIFSHWSGDVPSYYSNPVTIAMNSNKTVTANFDALVPILPSVSITATDSSAGEPYNDGYFTVSRTGDTSEILLVYYSTSGSTASAGTDYTALSGYEYIYAGQSSASIAVDLIDDSTVESSETVRLTISSNAAYTIGSPSYATVTITDDDEEPPVDETIVTISAPDASAAEPANNGSFRVSRTGDTSKKLRVYYITSGSTASAGIDYERLPGYVYIPAGQSSANVSVDVIDDKAIEDPETVRLTLRSISSYTKYTIGSSDSANVTIADDDSGVPDETVVSISATDASAAEPANDGYFTISRTGDTSSSLLVYYSTSGSTASPGADYAALPGYMYIPAGQSSSVISVDVYDDSTVESSEILRLTVSTNAAYTVGSPSYATVTITDDDDVPPPPSDDAEQMMADTLTFFYASVDDGSLVGVGVYNLYRMRWILETAYDQIAGGDYTRACGQLSDVLSRCDGYNDPPDYVSGSATVVLAGMIQEVINELGCG